MQSKSPITRLGLTVTGRLSSPQPEFQEIRPRRSGKTTQHDMALVSAYANTVAFANTEYGRRIMTSRADFSNVEARIIALFGRAEAEKMTDEARRVALTSKTVDMRQALVQLERTRITKTLEAYTPPLPGVFESKGRIRRIVAWTLFAASQTYGPQYWHSNGPDL